MSAPRTVDLMAAAERSYRQRGLTFDQLSDLLLAARRSARATAREERECAEDTEVLREVFAALMSIVAERDRFKVALERIATGAYTRPGARDRAQEALQP